MLICDGFALYQVFFKDDLKLLDDYTENDLHVYNFSKGTIATFIALDALAFLFSILNLLVVCCLSQKHCESCTRHWFSLFILFCFCRKHTHNSINSMEEGGRPDKVKHQEYRLWLLMLSFTAPLVCTGTHSSYMVLAWTSDTQQANFMTVVFILSFIYYFLGFRQLYIILAQGCCVMYVPKVPPTVTDDLVQLENSSESSESYVDINVVGGSNSQFCCVTFNNEDLSIDVENHRKKLKHFNFQVLLCELIVILPLLTCTEALVVLVYFFLPVPVITVPSNVLSIFHLTLIIGTGLIAYKFLTAKSEGQAKIGETLGHVI